VKFSLPQRRNANGRMENDGICWVGAKTNEAVAAAVLPGKMKEVGCRFHLT